MSESRLGSESTLGSVSGSMGRVRGGCRTQYRLPTRLWLSWLAEGLFDGHNRLAVYLFVHCRRETLRVGRLAVVGALTTTHRAA